MVRTTFHCHNNFPIIPLSQIKEPPEPPLINTTYKIHGNKNNETFKKKKIRFFACFSRTFSFFCATIYLYFFEQR